MTTPNKNALLIAFIFLAILLVSIWGSLRVTWHNGLENLGSKNREQLQQFAGHLESSLSRFKFLPRLIAKNPLLLKTLEGIADAATIQQANQYLQEVNQITGALDTYLMDETGMTIAASNWESKKTFIGRNFSFRPYFTEAMKGNVGRYFALGSTSGKRGYYYSYPVKKHNRLLGVVVIKMDLSNIEHYWSERNTQFIVTDQNGIIFITTRPEWLYHSLSALPEATLEKINHSRRYGNTLIHTLDLQQHTRIDDKSYLAKIPGVKQDKSGYLVNQQDMPDAGWTISILSPINALEKENLVTALMVFLLAFSVLLTLLLILQRHKRQKENQQIQLEAQKQLENKISIRTADLKNEIEEHKQTEKALRDTQGELIQAAKLALLGQMSASISHELNNPLAAIRSYADNARQFLTLGNKENAIENLLRISDLTDRMAKISSQLKFFSRRSSGQLEPVKVSPIIQTALDIVKPQYKKLNIEIITEDVDDALEVHADIIQLEQVIINLVNNAINAIGNDKQGKIWLRCERRRGSLFIHVDDTGPGIGEKHLAKIFEPFFTTREAGLGLGLSISARIIDSMNGSLSANNLTEAGARFSIELPLTENRI